MMRVLKWCCFLVCLVIDRAALGQSRFFAEVAQENTQARFQRSWVSALPDGQTLTAVLLASKQAVELLYWDACGYVLRRQQLRASATMERLIGLWTDKDGAVLLALQGGAKELIMARLDPQGSISWAKVYRSAVAVHWVSLDVDASGHIILGGYSLVLSHPLLLKMSAQGDILWCRRALFSVVSGRACSTYEGGALQLASREHVLKWTSDGDLEWAVNVQSTSPMGLADVQPVEVSDGFVLVLRLSFDYLHLLKISHQGKLEWISSSFPTDNFGTADILFGIAPQRILRFHGDSILLIAFLGKGGERYITIHVVDHEGKVVFQNLLQPAADVFTQGFSVSSGYVAAVGWTQSGTTLLRMPLDLVLGCGDFQTPPLANPVVLGSVEKMPLLAVEDWPQEVEPFFLSISSLPPYKTTFYCQKNDSLVSDLTFQRPTCLGEVVYLRPDAPKGATITWPDGQQDTLWRVEGPGTYTAQVDYCGLQWKVEYHLEAQDCHCKPIYPNAFTPDGDGINDTFGPIDVPECAYRAFEWSVFNRWGQRIFEANSPHSTWDGRLPNGQVAPSDVYVWQLRYALPNGNDTVWFVQKGDVTLLR